MKTNRFLMLTLMLATLPAILAASDKRKKRSVPVEVVNEPTVHLANPDVLVANDESMPVPVVVVEKPERGERVQFLVDVIVPVGESFACTDVAMPPDHRIEVDQISGDVRMRDSDERAVALLAASPEFTGGFTGLFHYFPLTAAGANISVGPTFTNYFFNEQPNVFSDGRLRACLSRGPTPGAFPLGAFMRVAISGRLVPLPD